MFILDSDTVTMLHAEHPGAARRLETNADECVTTIITIIEILRGRSEFLMKAATKEQFLQAQQLLRSSAQKLSDLPIVFLDEAALDQFQALQDRKGLKKIGRADLLIASIVLSRHATLVTRNLKHFKLIPHLQCENWVD